MQFLIEQLHEVESFFTGVLGALSSNAVGDTAQKVPEVSPTSICTSGGMEVASWLHDVGKLGENLRSGFGDNFGGAIAQQPHNPKTPKPQNPKTPFHLRKLTYINYWTNGLDTLPLFLSCNAKYCETAELICISILSSISFFVYLL